MAQSRAKRKQRSRRPVPSGPSPATERRSTRRRRIVIAFLVLVGIAGILAVATPDDAGNGAPSPPETGQGAAR